MKTPKKKVFIVTLKIIDTCGEDHMTCKDIRDEIKSLITHTDGALFVKTAHVEVENGR